MKPPPVVLWDLDNCLADDAWRIPFINWASHDPVERYHTYHLLSCADDSHHHALFREHIAAGHVSVFITGRPEYTRRMTTDWIARHIGIQPPELQLLMRPNDDNRPSVEVKRALLADRPLLRARVVAAYDDHPDIVAMYADTYGIRAQLLSIHSVCAHTNPFAQGAAA